MTATALAIVPRPSTPLQRALPADPELDQQARQRLDIIRPLLHFKTLPYLIDGVPAKSTAVVAAHLAATHGVSERTLWRWVRLVKQHGLVGLADSPRADKGKSRWAAKSEQHAQLAELAVYIRYCDELSIQEAWEKVAARAQSLGIAPPDYKTVRGWIESVPAPVKMLALHGREKYNRVFAPHIARGYEDFEAGEILVSDHMIHDVLVQNDLFDAKDREHMRLRFTGLQDMRSRKMVGYAWSQEGSSRSIVSCLRQSILRYGVFRLLYVDNGKDYQKVARGAVPAWRMEDIPLEAMGVVARLGAEVKHCIPFAPQAKLIERANGTIHQRFDKHWRTYTGSTPEQRPDKCIAALERHKKLLSAGRPEDSDLPLASEFIRAALLWIEGEFNRRPQAGKGMQGLSPDDAFEKFRWQKQPPAPSPAELAALLAERVERMVQRGSVMLDGVRFVAADETSSQELHDRSGQNLLMAFDPLDRTSAAAIDSDGRVVAWLEPERLLRQSDDDETRSQIAASMQDRRRRYRETREALEDLSRRVLATGYRPHHEQMLQLGRAPIDISGLVVHRPAQKLRPDTIEPENSMVPGDAADRLAERLRRNRGD